MDKNKINRRGFLRALGVSGAAVALARCGAKSEEKASDAPAGTASPKKASGEMTYRTNSVTGDKVSLLGYGCMRLPTLPESRPDGDNIDQETVNRLVDYRSS